MQSSRLRQGSRSGQPGWIRRRHYHRQPGGNVCAGTRAVRKSYIPNCAGGARLAKVILLDTANTSAAWKAAGAESAVQYLQLPDVPFLRNMTGPSEVAITLPNAQRMPLGIGSRVAAYRLPLVELVNRTSVANPRYGVVTASHQRLTEEVLAAVGFFRGAARGIWVSSALHPTTLGTGRSGRAAIMPDVSHRLLHSIISTGR